MEIQNIEGSDFEEAIDATGFGLFNVILILATLPPSFSQIAETNSMSYVLLAAQCDLNLTLQDKGLLNSISFIGMITTGLFWGNLSDFFGRKKIIVYGSLLTAICVLISAFSQNFIMLIIAKFFSGAIMNGVTSAFTAILSEFHSSSFRARIQLIRGTVLTMGTILLPLLALPILPQEISFQLFKTIQIHSWNIFLVICALAPISSFIMYSLLPESPKFLLYTGKNEEALNVFRKMYRLNSGKPEYTYPIKKLAIDTLYKAEEKVGFFDSLKSLFSLHNIPKVLITCANAHLLMMSTNVLKFWMPQLLQTINDYQNSHNGSTSNMCNMLEGLATKNDSAEQVCSRNLENESVYINSIIIGVAQVPVFLISGIVIKLIGQKTITVITHVIAGLCAFGLYFTQDVIAVISVLSLCLASSAVAQNLTLSITIELFETGLRTSAVSLYYISARVGSVLGNMIYPSLLRAGCMESFLFLGALYMVGAALSLLFPNTENKALM